MAAGGIRSRRLDQRFRVEAELVARLKHPNIVQVYETGESATVHYLVLEYVSGGTLAQRLMGKPQPERWAAEAAPRSRRPSSTPTSKASCIAI